MESQAIKHLTSKKYTKKKYAAIKMRSVNGFLAMNIFLQLPFSCNLPFFENPNLLCKKTAVSTKIFNSIH